MADSIAGLFQAFSSAHKENASNGFFTVAVKPTRSGVDFYLFEGMTADKVRGAGMFSSLLVGEEAVRDFRKHAPITFEWMRTETETTYKDRAKKSP